ncbi:MAG: TIGR01212 family radical SAM protein [Oscillospiraceae bacterium]|nr:TIGR01212 family radical SAM protein [Oscillospiraceae bacterium]
MRANEYYRARFGCKVYKLALDGGMTCPNRDGTKGNRGCIFCSGAGSGDFAEQPCGSVTAQIEAAKRRVAAKMENGKYIAYFQSFTNTYAPVSRLEPLFAEAITHPDVAALSVATRPDCLPDDVLALLARLDRIKPVFVELGLQTIHPETAAWIRRGYPLPDYDRAVSRLRALGLHTVVHVILGLPGETEQMMVQTAAYVARSGADGIKLQLLHVLEGTDLAALWRAGRVPTLSLEDYARLLGRCLAVLPPEMVIHRLTGDGAKKALLAPLWSADKKRVLNYVNRYLSARAAAEGERQSNVL